MCHNLLSVVKAALRAVHGAEEVENEVSTYYLRSWLNAKKIRPKKQNRLPASSCDRDRCVKRTAAKWWVTHEIDLRGTLRPSSACNYTSQPLRHGRLSHAARKESPLWPTSITERPLPSSCFWGIWRSAQAWATRSCGTRLLASLGFSDECLDFVFDGFRPDLIALGSQVQEVRHHLFTDGAIWFQEPGGNIHILNRSTVKFRNQLVDGGP